MDLICFSHLRWNFVYQRPQHLLSRFAKKRKTFYVEEHLYSNDGDGYTLEYTNEGVTRIIPFLNKENNINHDNNARLKIILDKFFSEHQITQYMFWYYTPMAIPFTYHFTPALVVYDCMDELSAFKFAPPELRDNEHSLLGLSDLVFTGGNSLYRNKKQHHPNVWSMPSSIDKAHFQVARYMVQQPFDQEEIPHPRLGFFGVIDERFDIALIDAAAQAVPEWNFIFIGPVVKIDESSLPRHKNIHYLGGKTYQQLPSYLSGWDVALIPFAINESTEYISPTKTPEYLAAGIPVVSTPIKDVIDPYGDLNLVSIGYNVEEFISKVKQELSRTDRKVWLHKVDNYLAKISWDNTWEKMDELIKQELNKKSNFITQKV